MGPAKVDLSGIRAGDRNVLTFTVLSAGGPFDLTGIVATAQARQTPDATVAIDAVVTITDAPGGVLTVEWPGAAVSTALAGATTYKGVWDLQLAGNGWVLTVAEGTFAAVLDVTRP
jgi:hypothetical protein